MAARSYSLHSFYFALCTLSVLEPWDPNRAESCGDPRGQARRPRDQPASYRRKKPSKEAIRALSCTQWFWAQGDENQFNSGNSQGNGRKTGHSGFPYSPVTPVPLTPAITSGGSGVTSTKFGDDLCAGVGVVKGTERTKGSEVRIKKSDVRVRSGRKIHRNVLRNFSSPAAVNAMIAPL